MSEHDLQCTVASMLTEMMEQDKLFFFHPPNAPRSKIAGGKLKAAGMKAGVPDCVITFPKGQTIFIELKFGRGRLSKTQEVVQAQLQRMEIPSYVVTSDNCHSCKGVVRGIISKYLITF